MHRRNILLIPSRYCKFTDNQDPDNRGPYNPRLEDQTHCKLLWYIFLIRLNHGLNDILVPKNSSHILVNSHCLNTKLFEDQVFLWYINLKHWTFFCLKIDHCTFIISVNTERAGYVQVDLFTCLFCINSKYCPCFVKGCQNIDN